MMVSASGQILVILLLPIFVSLGGVMLAELAASHGRRRRVQAADWHSLLFGASVVAALTILIALNQGA